MSLNAKLAAIAVGAISVCATVTSPSVAADKIVVTIPAISVNFAPYLIAFEKGYYAEEGIEFVRLNAPGATATAALLSGTVGVSTSSSSSLSAILRGAALRIVYVMSERPAYQVWSTDPNIRTLHDLKGKSVGVQSRGDTYEIGLRLALQAAGLPQDWCGYTPLGGGNSTGAAVISGSLPAAVLTSEEAEQLRGSGALQRGHMLVNMIETIRMPYTGAVVSEKTLKDNPGMVTRFMKGTIKGSRYMRLYREQTNAIMRKHGSTFSERTMDVAYDDLVSSLTKAGDMADDELRKDMEVRGSLMSIAKEKLPPINQVYDFRIVRTVNADLDASGWKPAK